MITEQTLFVRLAQHLCIDTSDIDYIVDRSFAEKCSPFDYLVVSRCVPQDDIYRELAALLRVGFCDAIKQSKIITNAARPLNELANVKAIRTETQGKRCLVMAPDFRGICGLIRALNTHPSLGEEISLVSPKQLLSALVAHHSEQLTDYASWGLSKSMPQASAFVALKNRPLILTLAFLMLGAVALVALPQTHAIFSIIICFLLFLVPSLLRFLALFAGLLRHHHEQPIRPLSEEELPTYSILVPLHHEHDLVPQLVHAIDRIDYPRSKLDVTFVVEQASVETLSALRSACLVTPYNIVAVPHSEPTTKPKALDFALPFSTGKHVVVYDAEDIPHPGQLRWAAAHFWAYPTIDCFQAELVIDNARASFLSGLFAGEYAGLFGVYLPMLARFGLPLPLGGTSNHFRRQALREVGAWDAHNVTEDADLGMRLARLRYRCGTLSPAPASKTHEDAPTQFLVWLRQRTRWLKGWMVTYIVHNQHPRTLLQDLGLKQFLFFQFLIGGMVLSSPLHLFSLIYICATWLANPNYFSQLSPVSVTNLCFLGAGYISVILINIFGLTKLRRGRLIPVQFMQPVYWLLISFAAIRALIQLRKEPHKWEKTPHLARRDSRQRRHRLRFLPNSLRG